MSEKLADRVWEIVTEWNFLAQDTVGKQLIRSAVSIITRELTPKLNAYIRAIGTFELDEQPKTKSQRLKTKDGN